MFGAFFCLALRLISDRNRYLVKPARALGRVNYAYAIALRCLGRGADHNVGLYIVAAIELLDKVFSRQYIGTRMIFP